MSEENKDDIIKKNGSRKYYKILIPVIAVLVVFAIIKVSFIATKDVALDVATKCELGLSDVEEHFFSEINNMEDAQNVMSGHMGENVTFVRFILELCGEDGGAAYYFNTSENIYRLCEDGTLQRFTETCKTRGVIGEMIISAVEILDTVL